MAAAVAGCWRSSRLVSASAARPVLLRLRVTQQQWQQRPSLDYSSQGMLCTQMTSQRRMARTNDSRAAYARRRGGHCDNLAPTLFVLCWYSAKRADDSSDVSVSSGGPVHDREVGVVPVDVSESEVGGGGKSDGGDSVRVSLNANDVARFSVGDGGGGGGSSAPVSFDLDLAKKGKLYMEITCTECKHRIKKYISKQAYQSGIVIVTCDSCDSRHLLKDNLGWFNRAGQRRPEY